MTMSGVQGVGELCARVPEFTLKTICRLTGQKKGGT